MTPRRRQSPTAITWAALKELEPGLALLEAELHEVADDGVRFCANATWYGYRGHPGFKSRLSKLVGWSRRGEEWRIPIPESAGIVVMTGGELFARAEAAEPARVAAFAEDIAHGREVLWSSGAYDTAYDHLYVMLPGCRRCSCWDVAS